MRAITLFFWISIATVCFGQKTVHFADSIRLAYKIPEINYAVVDSRKTLEIAALGKHSTALSDTATLRDRFHIGSNTKAMTAFIVAKYVEKGKLAWTTPFFDLFPDMKPTSKSAYWNITLADLLSHRAGIQPFQGENDPEIPTFKGNKQRRRKQFGQFVLTQEPVVLDENNPFVYSNADYTLATLMLEKATGKSWEKLVKKVFNLELDLDVKLSWPENQREKGTWGHFTDDGKLTPVPSNSGYHLDYTEPAGDINIRLIDYIKFIQLHLDGLSGHDNYLTAKTYSYMHQGIEHYSLGWYNIYENGQSLSTHSGTVGTYYTLVHIDRIHHKAYIIFTNAFNEDVRQGVRLLMRKLKENYEG